MCTRRQLLVIVTMLLLSACQPPQVKPQQTATPSPLPPSPTLTPTATSTSTPSPTPLLATPTLSLGIDAPIPLGSEFSPCELPCWNGLRVGQSTTDDVLAVWNVILGVPDSSSLVVQHRRSLSELRVPDTDAFGYLWELPGDLFGAYMLTDSDTGILQGIFFLSVQLNEAYDMRTVTQLIKELGIPTYIYGDVLAHPTELTIRIFLVYEQGMTFLSTSRAPIQRDTVGGIEIITADYCLDNPIDTGSDYIFPPFEFLDPDSLTPIQQEGLRHIVHPNAFYRPIEEEFGISNEDFTQVALAESPCLTFDSETLKVIAP